MESLDFVKAYQWNYRPKTPKRPAWFTQWPGGARIAVTINVMHEWESKPGPHTMGRRPMPADTSHTDDFMALGAREYGANFGIWRLLERPGQTWSEGDRHHQRLDGGTLSRNGRGSEEKRA